MAVAPLFGAANAAHLARAREVDSLCDGAALLCRAENRIAALALLWAAVAIDPTSLMPHRRLAAMLGNAGDLDGAADEYARFIEFALKQGDVRRAADELAYGIAALGEQPKLQQAAARLVPLGEIARAFTGSAPVEARLDRVLSDGQTSQNGHSPEHRVPPPSEEPEPSPKRPELLAPFAELASRIDATGLRSVGFTSAAAGQGASTIALGTALALAERRGEAVLLIDANWLRPSLTADARLESAAGLSECLGQQAALGSVSVRRPGTQVALVPVGMHDAAGPSPHGVASFLATAVGTYRTVVVDLPPILEGERFVKAWARSIERLFVVAGEGGSSLEAVQLAIAVLGDAAAHVIVNRTAADGMSAASI